MKGLPWSVTAREPYIQKDCHRVLQIKGLPGSATIKMTARGATNQRTAKECYNQNDCQGAL